MGFRPVQDGSREPYLGIKDSSYKLIITVGMDATPAALDTPEHPPCPWIYGSLIHRMLTAIFPSLRCTTISAMRLETWICRPYWSLTTTKQ